MKRFPIAFARIGLTAIFAVVLLPACAPVAAQSIDVKQTASYRRIKAHLDATPAIDTHDHLPPFNLIHGRVETDRGLGMNLHSLWQSSYYTWFNPLTAWPKSGKFNEWWPKAKHDFDNARATSFYRYQLPAFTDLYGVNFDIISDEQARTLDDRIFEHYRDPAWAYEVITERANIELVVMDPYWNRLGFEVEYPFAVPTVNVTPYIRGIHPSDFANTNDSPFVFATRENMKLESLLLNASWRLAKPGARSASKPRLLTNALSTS